MLTVTLSSAAVSNSLFSVELGVPSSLGNPVPNPSGMFQKQQQSSQTPFQDFLVLPLLAQPRLGGFWGGFAVGAVPTQHQETPGFISLL